MSHPARMSLATLEQAFQSYVLDGVREIAARVEPGPLANHERRLRVYYDAYRLRLVEALSSDYEALHAVLGQDGFREAALAYVEAHPSVFRNVRWYGAALPNFLRRAAPWLRQPWLAELARFEWTLTLAFDAPDAPHAVFSDLAALPAEAWGALTFDFHPSVHLVSLRSNAPAMRTAIDAGASLPPVEMRDEPIDWLVWRKDLVTRFRSLSRPESWALQSARQGNAFPTLCEGLCEFVSQSEAPALAASWLRAWVDDQLIARAIVPEAVSGKPGEDR